MSDLNSWEDDPAAQDDSLLRQIQQISMSGQKTNAGTFRPSANSFQPSTSSIQSAQNFEQYNVDTYQNYYKQQDTQSSYGPPQYDQNGFNRYQHQTGYGPVYHQSYGQQQYPVYGQQPQTTYIQQGPYQTSTNTKRPFENPTTILDSNKTTTKDKAPKVLSISSDSSKPKAKVLSIGLAPNAGTKKEVSTSTDSTITQEFEAKTFISKAIEKNLDNDKTSPAHQSGRSSPSRVVTKPSSQDTDAVQKEIALADVDDETLKEIYGKEHVNIIFIGHVDAGKSTLGGAILIQSGMIDQRTLDKYKKEAKDMARESWWISWVLDLNKEERSQGKTIEVGRAFFETEKRRYSILDAPGHKTYVPSMIGGASQADVGILVISARKGEYETGFEKGGQTREHAMLAKTQGVNKLVVAINKMDDPTVEWSEKRYIECITKLSQFLKATGYNLKNDIYFIPIAAQQMLGLKDRVPENICPWYKGPSLLEYLDSMAAVERKINAPFMMPINGKYRDMGTIVEGKVEAGVIKKGISLVMMPNREKVEAAAIYGETEEEVTIGQSGDQIRLRLRGIEEEDILPGFVLCSPKRLVHCVSAFEAQIRVLDLKNILSAGFNCVLHVHSAIEEVTFAALLHTLQKGTGRKSKKAPTHAKKGDSIIARIEVTGGAGTVCVERFVDYQQLGRFTLRDQKRRRDVPKKEALKGFTKKKVKPLNSIVGVDDILIHDVIALLNAQKLENNTESNTGKNDNDGPNSVVEVDCLPKPFTEVQVEVKEISSTGDGLAIHPESKRIYVVPFCVPGDTIKAKVIRHLKNEPYSLADFESVVKAGPLRDDTQINCKYFATCSGCQFQMLSYDTQLRFKKKIIERAYKNFSNLPNQMIPLVGEIIGSPLQYGYRTKLTPHFDAPKGHSKKTCRMIGVKNYFKETPKIGFNAKYTKHTLDIEDCPIGTDAVRMGMRRERHRVAENLHKYTKGATILLRESTLRLENNESNRSINTPDTIKILGPEFIDFKSCVTDNRAKTTEYVDKFVFTNIANEFFQNNNSILPRFTQYIRDHIFPSSRSRRKIKNLIDAYSGSGLFTITLSSLFQSSLGIDISATSISSAEENARQNSLPSSQARFIAADASQLFKEITFHPDETVVLIDPSRKGCDEAFISQLLDFAPQRIMYVSCNVHTQARDVGKIINGLSTDSNTTAERNGEKTLYTLESLIGFDFFPQTSHVESVAVLDKIVHDKEINKSNSALDS